MAEEKGYTVKDKRKVEEKPRTEGEPGGSETRQGECSVSEEVFHELGFSTFILSLSTSALVHLGDLPDPTTNERQLNPSLAKQTIDIIEMMKEKTKGNLTGDEERLIDNVLFDLRLKYVKAVC